MTDEELKDLIRSRAIKFLTKGFTLDVAMQRFVDDWEDDRAPDSVRDQEAFVDRLCEVLGRAQISVSVTWDGDKAAELAPIKPSIAPEDIERGKKYRVAFDGVAVNCASHGLAVSNIYLEFNDAALDCASRIEEIDPLDGDNK